MRLCLRYFIYPPKTHPINLTLASHAGLTGQQGPSRQRCGATLPRDDPGLIATVAVLISCVL